MELTDAQIEEIVETVIDKFCDDYSEYLPSCIRYNIKLAEENGEQDYIKQLKEELNYAEEEMKEVVQEIRDLLKKDPSDEERTS
jgi:iron-sulfur cluster repair protein YtfE (RIC family)